MNENKSSMVLQCIGAVLGYAAFGMWTGFGWRLGNKIWDDVKCIMPANHKELEVEQEEETTEE